MPTWEQVVEERDFASNRDGALEGGAVCAPRLRARQTVSSGREGSSGDSAEAIGPREAEKEAIVEDVVRRIRRRASRVPPQADLPVALAPAVRKALRAVPSWPTFAWPWRRHRIALRGPSGRWWTH